MTTPSAAYNRARTLADKMSNKMLINGKTVPAVSGNTFEVINPATLEVIAHAPAGDYSDVDLAVSSAKSATGSWRAYSARARGKLLIECSQNLLTHAPALAELLALETGKAIRTESRAEPGLAAEIFSFFGGLAGELKGETVPFDPHMITMTRCDPLGVVGVIIPWNVPVGLMAFKVAAALAAGNTVVVKPAEEAPLSVLRACEIIGETLPRGVLNVVTGDGPTCGGPLVDHKDVSKVTFTGSVETGRAVYKAAAERIIPVTLELGGKSPMIVMADANLDKAVSGAVNGMRFTRQGQSCTAASRIFVHEDLHDQFINKLKVTLDEMVIGDPLDEATDIGTIISQEQFAKVNEFIDLGDGCETFTTHRCSALPRDPALSNGYFVQPTIFSGATNDHPLSREEIFGPVTCVMKFADFDEVMALANDTDFGLAGSIWTNDLSTALQFTDRLDAGFVQVNQNLVVQPGLSYGGFKNSGLGKEATLEAMRHHFTKQKTIILNMGD